MNGERTMDRAFARLVLATLALGVGACGMLAGVDGDYHTVELCESGRECVAGPPAGFFGPISFTEGVTSDATCGGEFPQPASGDGLIFAELTAAKPECSCSCDALPSACSSAEIEIHDGPGCADPSGQPETITTGCTTLSIPAGKSLELAFSPCDVEPTKTIPKLSFGSIALGCRAPAGGSCSAGECMPPLPADAQRCVFREGDHECPAGEYTKKKVYYGAVDDTRGCTPCSCKGCGQVELYQTACSGAPMMTHATSKCVNFPSGADGHATYASKTCAAHSGGDTEGTATPIEPVTLCCVPES